MCKDVVDVSVKQKYPNASDNEKIMLSPEVTGLLSYMGDNATALLLMAMVEKVGLKDLQTLNAIENKHFFESYKKANLSLANDLPTIMAKLLAGKKEEIKRYEDELAMLLITRLCSAYPGVIGDRFGIDEKAEDVIPLAGQSEESARALTILEAVGQKRGCLVKGGGIDYSRASAIMLDEFRSGNLGRITLEKADA